MNVLNQQLKKGVLEIIILKIIAETDVYGYELIKTMEQTSNGYFTLKEGSLYPILYRLEDKNLIESYQKSFEGKRRVPRKYYRITSEGLEILHEMIQEWSDFKMNVTNMLENKKEGEDE